MGSANDHLDDGRSNCVKQAYLDKIRGFYLLYANKFHCFMSSQNRTFAKCVDQIYSIVSTPSPSALLNVAAKDNEKCVIIASNSHLIILNTRSESWDVYHTIANINRPVRKGREFGAG
eukprot:15364540-Ditylum_brightwellii.AAC.2